MAWTDDPLIPGQHIVRSIHIEELRNAIDALNNVTCPTKNITVYSSYNTVDDGSDYTTVDTNDNSAYQYDNITHKHTNYTTDDSFDQITLTNQCTTVYFGNDVTVLSGEDSTYYSWHQIV